MFVLWFFALPAVAALGEYGLCLYNLTLPTNAYAICEPPNQIPQDCSMRCAAGYYPIGTYDVTCMNSICTNRCRAIPKTCRGAIPIQQIDAYGVAYTGYTQVEEPCCELKTAESDWCSLGSCTGNCENPGLYTFDPIACPDTCIPFQEISSSSLKCEPCVLPALAQGIYTDIVGSPPSKATVGCPAGMWGTTQDITCTNTGSWSATPNVTCSACPPHPYALDTLDREVFAVEENAGSVRITCREPVYVPTTWTFECGSTGEWSYWDDPVCHEAVTATPTPTTSATPEPTSSVTPSPSKSPRPPKIKGSRAPTQAPKLRGALPSRS